MSLSEILSKAEANPVTALFYVGGAAICAGLSYLTFRDRFRKPTPTGFDNPEIKASRERSAELMRKLGIEPNRPKRSNGQPATKLAASVKTPREP